MGSKHAYMETEQDERQKWIDEQLANAPERSQMAKDRTARKLARAALEASPQSRATGR